MIHLDLFSGIGGFALAVEEVWPEAQHIFCEINPYCQALLKLKFKGAKIYGDIRELTTDTYTSGCIHKQLKEQPTKGHDKAQCQPVTSVEPPFLLTGGFPCQPFSQAGKRKGTSDNRYLWPEMLRVIREFQPTWVIAENVRGLLTINEGLVFEQVCLDLEREGYQVQPFVIPACAVNAPHRRDRIWIVANCTGNRLPGERQGIEIKERLQPRSEPAGQLARGFKGPYCDVTDTRKSRLPGEFQRKLSSLSKKIKTFSGSEYGRTFATSEWRKPWLEVATELCRMDDGLPAELDGLKLSKSKHREERLKALGNAIVPQVAIEIMRAIKEVNP